MKVTMEEFFKKIDFNIEDMEINKGYDISDKNIKILSYDFNTKSNMMKKIEKIVYKGKHDIFYVKDLKNNILLKGNAKHRIFDITKNDFVFLDSSKMGLCLKKDGTFIEYIIENTQIEDHIVDMQIEGENYFSNNILSHNTVFHTFLSEGIEDWTRIKSFLQKVMQNTKIPYITISPTFSNCQIHGFIKGNTNGICPYCKEEAIQGYKEKLAELEDKKMRLENTIEK